MNNILLTIILGFLFGVILQRSRINTYNKIVGFALLKDFTMPKLVLVAVGVGSILLFMEIKSGMALLNIKSLDVTGIVFGSIIFGIGMAILGYCPSTMVAAIGEGAVDAIIGFAGALVGGFAFIFLQPFIKDMLGPFLGKPNLYFDSDFITALIVLSYGACLIFLAFLIDMKAKEE